MSADVYFWSDATGTLAFKGVDYDLGDFEEREPFMDRPFRIGARPTVTSIDLETTETTAALDRIEAGVDGLLWRVEGGAIRDMVRVSVTEYAMVRIGAYTRRVATFSSCGEFVATARNRETASRA